LNDLYAAVELFFVFCFFARSFSLKKEAKVEALS